MTGISLQGESLENLFWILAVLTMTVGNIMALRQSEVKRMLAFSSIAHAGYVMIAVVVGNESAISGIIFYFNLRQSLHNYLLGKDNLVR